MAGTYEKKDYLESEAVKNAREQMAQHSAAKPAPYQSQWQPQMMDTFDKIQNRQPFQYDINSDALYQQYKDQYSMLGNQAMMDTMGQASALTGGYGNSYAQTAGQQAYQGYLQQLNNVMPGLYSAALDRYNAEGDALARQYSMMADQENLDYARYRDLMADHENQYNRLYNAYRDEQALDYSTYRDMIADLQWQAQFDEDVRRYNQEWEAQQAAAAAKASSSGGSRRSYTPVESPEETVVDDDPDSNDQTKSTNIGIVANDMRTGILENKYTKDDAADLALAAKQDGKITNADYKKLMLQLNNGSLLI